MLTNGRIPPSDVKQAEESPPVVMMSKVFSEGIYVINKGPQTKLDYSTECSFVPEKSYRSSVAFVSRLVPKFFVTTVRVDGEEQSVTHYQRIDFARRTRPVQYGESVNFFPKVKTSEVYTTTLKYDPDFKECHYVTRLDLTPVQRAVVQLQPAPCILPSTCNGEELNLQGDTHRSSPLLLNGTA